MRGVIGFIVIVICIIIHFTGLKPISDLFSEKKNEKNEKNENNKNNKKIFVTLVAACVIAVIINPDLSSIERNAKKAHDFVWSILFPDKVDEGKVEDKIVDNDEHTNSDVSPTEEPDSEDEESTKPDEEDNNNRPDANNSTSLRNNNLTPDNPDNVAPSPNDTSTINLQDVGGTVADSGTTNSLINEESLPHDVDNAQDTSSPKETVSTQDTSLPQETVSNQDISLPQETVSNQDISLPQDTVSNQDTFIQTAIDYSTVFPSYSWGGELLSVTYTEIDNNTEQQVISSTTTISGGELLYEYSEDISDEVVYPEF